MSTSPYKSPPNGRRGRRIDILVAEIGEKAQELQNLDTSLVSARDEITVLVERKSRLTRECEDILKRTNEAALSLITAETEYQKKLVQILSATNEIKRVNQVLDELQPRTRELDSINVSLTEARREIITITEKKSHLLRENEEIKKSASDAILSFSQTQTEHQKARTRIFETTIEVERLTQTLKELQAVVIETKGYLAKHTAARDEYVSAKAKLDETVSKQDELDARNAKEKREIEIANREMGQYKNYLTDFYGKVATYVKVARETLEYVNGSLTGTAPLVFTPPQEPLTMDNFTKYYDL